MCRFQPAAECRGNQFKPPSLPMLISRLKWLGSRPWWRPSSRNSPTSASRWRAMRGRWSQCGGASHPPPPFPPSLFHLRQNQKGPPPPILPPLPPLHPQLAWQSSPPPPSTLPSSLFTSPRNGDRPHRNRRPHSTLDSPGNDIAAIHSSARAINITRVHPSMPTTAGTIPVIRTTGLRIGHRSSIGADSSLRMGAHSSIRCSCGCI